MKSVVFLCTAALVLVTCAASRPTIKPTTGYKDPPQYSGAAYRSSPKSYGSSNPRTYGGTSNPSYGYNPAPRHFHHRGPSYGDEPLDDLDKLYETVADILALVKFFSEEVDALSAALSLQEKKVQNIITILFVELQETDIRQNSSIAKLEDHLYAANNDCSSLGWHLASLADQNVKNQRFTLLVENKWAETRSRNIHQDDVLAYLHSLIKDLKPKLFQVKKNEFRCFWNRVERDTSSLTSVKTRDARRMCEVGQVTLKADDRKSEYLYQLWFGNVPQVIYGIKGFNFDLDAREDPNTYGYGYPPKEPESLGVIVHSYSSKTGLILEGFDRSFGDTRGVTVDVAFQACTIGPGLKATNH